MVFWSNFIKKIKNAVSKERVDKLELKINTNATNIELIEQDVDTNTNNIGTIKNNITSINSSINDIDNEVTRLENNLTTTNNELDSLEARVNGYDDRINEANTKATQAEEQATRLGSTVSNNSTKIAALEGKNIKSITVDISQFTVGTDTTYGTYRYKQVRIDLSRLTPSITKSRIVGIINGVYIEYNSNGGIVSVDYANYPGKYEGITVSGLRLNGTVKFDFTGEVKILYI